MTAPPSLRTPPTATWLSTGPHINPAPTTTTSPPSSSPTASKRKSSAATSSPPPAAAAPSPNTSAKSFSTAMSPPPSTSPAISPGSNSTSKEAAIRPRLDRLDLWLRRINGPLPATGFTYIVTGSDDHTHWSELGRLTGTTWPSMNFQGPSFVQSIPFTSPSHHRYYRVQLSADGIRSWGVAELTPYDQGREVHLAGPFNFSSAWMSAGSDEEWVYVDLGAICTFDRVTLAWIQPRRRRLAPNLRRCRTLANPPAAPNRLRHWPRRRHPPRPSRQSPLCPHPHDEARRPRPAATSSASSKSTDAAASPRDPQTLQPVQQNGALNLTRGAWRLQRASLVPATRRANLPARLF